MNKWMRRIDVLLLLLLLASSTIIAVNLVLYSKALWPLIAFYWVVCSLRYWKEYILKVGEKHGSD